MALIRKHAKRDCGSILKRAPSRSWRAETTPSLREIQKRAKFCIEFRAAKPVIGCLLKTQVNPFLKKRFHSSGHGLMLERFTTPTGRSSHRSDRQFRLKILSNGQPRAWIASYWSRFTKRNLPPIPEQNLRRWREEFLWI